MRPRRLMLPLLLFAIGFATGAVIVGAVYVVKVGLAAPPPWRVAMRVCVMQGALYVAMGTWVAWRHRGRRP